MIKFLNGHCTFNFSFWALFELTSLRPIVLLFVWYTSTQIRSYKHVILLVLGVDAIHECALIPWVRQTRNHSCCWHKAYQIVVVVVFVEWLNVQGILYSLGSFVVVLAMLVQVWRSSQWHAAFFEVLLVRQVHILDVVLGGVESRI